MKIINKMLNFLNKDLPNIIEMEIQLQEQVLKSEKMAE